MILTIGAFDGFHQGHARLLARAREQAAGAGWGVVTFQPHPSVFMGTLRNTLFTIRERELMRRVLNIPNLFLLRFDGEMQALPPELFWRRLKRTFSLNGHDIDGVVMGRDFHFGRGQEGTAVTLEALCRRDGTGAWVVDLLRHEGVRFSSSEVRDLLVSGEARRAAEMLGYPWFLWSRVIRGNQRGRKMGFPTANLDVSDGRLLPAPGVYAAALWLEGKWRCGALSIGNNPTFDDVKETRTEVFVVDFDGDLYGLEFPVLLLDRLRPMGRFSGVGVLAQQISQDVLRCREIYEAEMAAKTEFYASFALCCDEMSAEGPFEPRIWRLAEC